MTVQDSPTSIRVTWTPPSPLGDTTGYRIFYTGGGGSSDSVDVDGGNTNSHTLMGLTNRETYTISIMGTSSIFSTPVEAGTVTLSKAILYSWKLLQMQFCATWESRMGGFAKYSILQPIFSPAKVSGYTIENVYISDLTIFTAFIPQVLVCVY